MVQGCISSNFLVIIKHILNKENMYVFEGLVQGSSS
jgi:hypothetical protein